MAGKGPYRGIYLSMVDDPEFQAMSPDERLLFFTLMVTPAGNVAGIFTAYREPLEAQSGLTGARYTNALDGLQRRKLIAREDRVVWVRDLLRDAPQYSLGVYQKLKGVLNALEALPRLAICRRFYDYYDLGAWIDAYNATQEGEQKPRLINFDPSIWPEEPGQGASEWLFGEAFGSLPRVSPEPQVSLNRASTEPQPRVNRGSPVLSREYSVESNSVEGKEYSVAPPESGGSAEESLFLSEGISDLEELHRHVVAIANVVPETCAYRPSYGEVLADRVREIAAAGDAEPALVVLAAVMAHRADAWQQENGHCNPYNHVLATREKCERWIDAAIKSGTSKNDVRECLETTSASKEQSPPKVQVGSMT